MPPLPSDVRVVQPVGVAQDLAAFSGKWQGVWDSGIDHILVVEEIKGGEAAVIYAWGDSPARGVSRGFSRVKGTFEGSTLFVWLLIPEPVATYQMRPDGKLDAKYDGGGDPARAIMTKVGVSRQ